ncbi:hypothetical protein ENSA5_69900 [Enhygromyxa salina]|uniref:Cellulose-binding domain protein n=1 Tax=Enhygromyxa salina TaxID=215803 RepID=A0A2S9XAJ9_9BACT|nr:hypothetical protein ENSA5_69900 [Enhygromyxa salina]
MLVTAPGCKSNGSSADGDDTGTDGDGTDTGEDGGDEDAYIPPPGGMRRLLDYQYLNTIEYMFGPEAAAVANPPVDPSLHGYTSIGAAQISPALDLVELYEASALAIADAAIANISTLAGIVPCVQSSPDQACYTTVAETLGHLAWRRPPTADEVAAIVEIALEAEAWGAGDFYAGLKYEIVRILLSPDFIYVVETGVQDDGEPGVYWLTGSEVVTRLSLLLIGRTPSLTLLESAEAGNYDSPDAVETLARAMLDDTRAPEAVSEFFGEYLALDDISAKDTEAFPLYSVALVDSMVEETELLLRDVIWTQNSDFRDFIEADYTFIDSKLAELYGVPPPENDWDMVMLPAEQARAGFISHASVLARNSHGAGNSTTRRGLYIQQRLLCFAIPPPPPEVNPQLPEIPDDTPMTLRELMETLHLEVDSCADCHRHMEPLGFTLENYDALGAWRTQEQNGLPIDAVAEYGDYGVLENAADLAANVAMDPRLGECIVNNIIRFGRGSLENPSNESEQLADLYGAFESSNYRFQELLVAFVTSELFLQVGEPK